MIRITTTVREAASLSEALRFQVKIEMVSDPSPDATEKEKRIAAKIRDSFDSILNAIAPIIEETEQVKQLPSSNVIDV